MSHPIFHSSMFLTILCSKNNFCVFELVFSVGVEQYPLASVHARGGVLFSTNIKNIILSQFISGSAINIEMDKLKQDKYLTCIDGLEFLRIQY